jgi:hypothetical protein
MARDLHLYKEWPRRYDGFFPQDPLMPAYYQVIREDLDGSVWTWHPNAGTAGEWWGDPWWDGFGVSGSTNSGQYFRRWNGMVMSATAGIQMNERIRLIRVGGAWSLLESGTIQIRQNGLSQGRNIPVSNANFVNFKAPTDNNTWLIGSVDPIIRQVLAGFWTGSTGAMNAAQFRMDGFKVRLFDE